MEEVFLEALHDKDSFVLNIFFENDLPKNHQNYHNNRIKIVLIKTENDKEYHVQIEKNRYTINEEKVNEIQNLVSTNFEELIQISLNQGNEKFFGGGKNINIKLKSVYITIDLISLNENDRKFVDSIIEKIIYIIKDKNKENMLPYNNFSKEKLNERISKAKEYAIKYGAIYVETRTQKFTTFVLDKKVEENVDVDIFKYKNDYFYINHIYFDKKPFIVFTFGETIENIFDDADPFPYDLSDEELENEIKQILN